MALTLIQAGTSLQLVDESGVATTLTLPTGIVLDSTKTPQFAQFGRFVVVVNSPNRPITVDPLGRVRVLTPYPPTTVLTLTGSTSGNLTGDYKAKQTFVIRDDFGNIISESDFGPLMTTAVTVAAKALTPSGINISPDDVTGSNLYRTTNGGEVYFLWRQLDGNTQTTADADDLADLSLDIFAAPTLGTPPDLTLVAEWRGRVWGVSRVEGDVARYTEAGSMYSWPQVNAISVPKIGTDSRGITALIPREESLIIGRRNVIRQVTGTNNSDFRVIDLSDKTGIEATDSVAVWDKVIYFLGKDGVYMIDANGVTNIAESANVKTWFTTDTYFNRSRFQYAFGYVDPLRKKYRLHLAAAGSSSNDRWVEYDINTGTWWGPHKTDEFTPSCGFVIADSGDRLQAVMGSSSGFIYQEQATAADGASAIDFDVDTNFYGHDDPDVEKVWGSLSMEGKVQTTGNLKITPYLGWLDAAARAYMYYVMSRGRHNIARLGSGKLLRFNFRNNTINQPVELYGYEIDDVHETGRR